MFLAFDIGNTNIKAAFFENSKLKEYLIFPLRKYSNEFLTKHNINSVGISSVNPEAAKIIKDDIVERLNIEPTIVNHNFPFSFAINYETPETLGIDRICSIEGALALIDDARLAKCNHSLITIDFGTATTINVLFNKVFVGGIIAPGLKTMINSLHAKTAQLPEIDLQSYASLIGTNTKSSIASGVINSTIGLIERFLYKSAMKNNLLIFVTGGNAQIILPFIEFEYLYNENLNLLGVHSVCKKRGY